MFAHSTRRVALAGFATLLTFNLSHAQVPPPITFSGLNTQVSGPIPVGGETQYDITGGTRPGGESGTNLFHSFGDFGVPPSNIANFLNGVSFDLNGVQLPPGLLTSNILARVTGTNGNNPTLSSIYGAIQTEGFGNANLFLLNPAGFLFGPNATVHVGGMVAFTSVDYLRLADNARFNAVPNATADGLISASPVAAFGFLGSNPSAITVQGSVFTVSEGQGISLVGGDIEVTAGTLDDGTTVQPAQFTAPGGQINLASVTSPGEVPATNFLPETNVTRGAITLSQGSTLDVSSDAAGTVRIRGGQFVMDNATISGDTAETHGAPIAVDIDVTGDLSISSNQNSAITARATGAGNAGEIRINSGNLDVDFAFPEFGVVIDSTTVGSGNAGKVSLTTGDLTATNNTTTEFVTYFIDSGTGGAGSGGDVTIKVRNGDFQGANINTGDAVFFGTGSAGDLYIGGTNGKAESLSLEANLLTEAFSAKGGSITLEGRDILIKNNVSVSSVSLLGENPITIEADRLVMDNVARVTTSTLGLGNGGDIVFRGNSLELTNDSGFLTQTFGDGDAGAIRVFADDHVRIADDPFRLTPSGLFTNSFGDQFGMTGKAGPIEVTTLRLDMTGGARFSTTTLSGGDGGNVTVTAPQGIFISGHRIGPPIEDISLGGSDGSGIYTSSIGTEFCGVLCGKAGNQLLNTGSLILNSGGTLDSGTTSTGAGGTIQVNATNQVVISGTLTDGSPGGVFSRTIGSEPNAGSGGNITLSVGHSVTISDGATISASSTGPGNTGNIQIDAGNQFAMTNSSVTTEATQAGGGAIKITTTPSGTVELSNSTISASVLDGTGGGGSVDIDPQFVILQNSQILAQAVQGPGGNIFITTNLLLQDANSVISASSQFGVNGTVTIQSPNAPASGKIQPLGKTPLQATSLLNQHCAALAGGEFSSFTVAGRDSLPTEPGNWLTSPLYAAGVGERLGGRSEGMGTGEGLGVRGEGREGLGAGEGLGVRSEGREGETALLSLRQITPAGFLTQAFAGDRLAGCQS